MQLTEFPNQTPTPQKRLWPYVALLIAVIALGSIGYRFVGQFQAHKRQEQERSKTLPKPERTITIREGWRLKDIADYLQKERIVDSAVFLQVAETMDTTKYECVNQKPASASLEGYMFPDTYRIFDYANEPVKPEPALIAQEVLGKLLGNFSKKCTPEMELAARQRGMTFHELVTLASILEKETGRNAVTPEQKQSLLAERKIVAGIFYNRLEIGMALQSDATVNYVTGKNLPSPTLEDTQVNSPYNTYKYKGLPPGPIGSPSLMSLEAASQPTASKYFYFLHDQTTGQAVYSRTFEEHVANKNRYLK